MQEEIKLREEKIEEIHPLDTMDYNIERGIRMNKNLPPYPLVETEGSKHLEELIENRRSGILIGSEGIGKSAAVQIAGYNLVINKQLKVMILRNISSGEIYNNLWQRISLPPQNAEKVMKYLYDYTQSRDWIGRRCKYWSCPKKDRCIFDVTLDHFKTEVTKEEVKDALDFIEISCPMKRKLLLTLFDQRFIIEHFKSDHESILVDLPNKFTKYDAKLLDDLIPYLLRLGNIVIVMNDRQYKICFQHENLRRLTFFKFPLPTKSEIKEIIYNRIKTSRRTDCQISDNAFDKIIALGRNNPRIIANFYSIYLTEHQLPCLPEIQKYKPLQSSNEIISLPIMNKDEQILISVIYDIKTSEPQWIKVKEIKNIILKNFDINISNERIGRILKNRLKLKHRNTPESEYLI